MMMISVSCEAVSGMRTVFFRFFFSASEAFASKQNRKPANAENGGRQLKLALIAQQLNSFSHLNHTERTKYKEEKNVEAV